jgi:hypothetical protein
MSKSQPQSKNLRDHANVLADRLAPHVETARVKAGPIIADARVKAAPLIADAREKAGPLLADARDKAAPALADARDWVAPALADARDKLTQDVLPAITAAIAVAGEATEEVRTEAMRRGAATAAALKGEVRAPEKTEHHRFRKLLILLGLGGVVAGVVKKLSDRQASTAWQSSYTPPVDSGTSTSGSGTPTYDQMPTATAGTTPPLATDEAAAGLDEAVADATETPHVATTPDDPADEIRFKSD